MKQVLLKRGRILVAEVPAPGLQPGMVRVAARATCISPGTETAAVRRSGASLAARALEQPEKALAALGRVQREGLGAVLQQVAAKRDEEQMLGYSAAGVVTEVAPGVTVLRVGDRVAVAGAGAANHADELVIPELLAAPIPAGVSFDEASVVAIGAIALQGVRRAGVELGERVVVIGCGVLGLLAVQMLRAAGCRVLACEPDAARRQMALDLGAEAAFDSGAEDVVRKVVDSCDGWGCDAVLIAAATDSSAPVHQAFRMCRRRGRVVLVGVAGNEYDRTEMYTRELDFRISTSYGPGRYDEAYERLGRDYPPAYVRWTEGRNMAAFLDLVARGAVRVAPMLGGRFPVDRAAEAYARLASADRPLLVVLTYAEEAGGGDAAVAGAPAPAGGMRVEMPRSGRMRLAVIGAGSFVRGMHEPNLLRMRDRIEVVLVTDQSGVAARQMAGRFPSCRAATGAEAAIQAADADAVLIGTRHDSHGRLTAAALRAGKSVFVEKPLALNDAELAEIEQAVAASSGLLMVGFNRRFSPYLMPIRRVLERRVNPAMLLYRVNAGRLPYDHWTQTAEGGGRIIGEACHILDLLRYLVGAPVASVSVEGVGGSSLSLRAWDNAAVVLRYAEGSVATLLYTAAGDPQAGKERLEVFADGATFVLDDYTSVRAYGARGFRPAKGRPDKGHEAEWAVFHDAWVKGVRFPIPWEELTETTRLSFRIARELQTA